MAWTQVSDFVKAAPMQRYQALHPWYHWDRDVAFDVLSAWRLYKRAQRPSLGFVLLGDTKLRRDPSLVQPFGLLSARAGQGEEELSMIAAMKIQAWWRGIGPPVLKSGSILSDQNWSPLLNDAMVLGGVHQRVEFHFTDPRLAGFNFVAPPGVQGQRALAEKRAQAMAAKRAALADRPWEVQVWRDFFQQHKDVLWDSTQQIPRVLARELVGLMSFGYEARPVAQQLTFVPGPKVPMETRANFGAYLDELQKADYFSRGRDQFLLATISKFLFGHTDALN